MLRVEEMSKLIIRDVEVRDGMRVLEYAKDFMEYYPVDIDYTDYDLLKVLEDISEAGIFKVAEKDGEIVGGVGGHITPYPYSPRNLVGTEMFLWVDEDHRGSMVGPRLLKEFEKACIQRGCKFISMTSTKRTPKFKDYLHRVGYMEVETSYIKGV